MLFMKNYILKALNIKKLEKKLILHICLIKMILLMHLLIDKNAVNDAVP